MSVKIILKKTAVLVTALLLGISVTATNLAMANSDTVTSFLGQSNSRIEKLDGTETIDLEHGYKSAYKSIKELVAAGLELQEREQAEGTVLLKNDNNALPLAKGSNVSVFGMTGAFPFYGASGSGGINTTEAIG